MPARAASRRERSCGRGKALHPPDALHRPDALRPPDALHPLPPPVLAYVFWHRRSQAADAQQYEAALVDFHRSLRRAPVAGLLTSRTLAVPRLPWLASGGYEDWYLVGDFAALGVLNAAVMDREHVAAHDRVAEGAGDGAGGVYALVAGDARQEPGNVIWCSKPRGVAYSEFRSRLQVRPRLAPDGITAVWQRQLVLGPAPEFRLVATGPVRLPFAGPHVDVTIRECRVG